MKKKTGRKPLSFLFALALLVGLVSGMSHVANADSITGYSPIDVTGFNAKTIAASTEADPTLTGVDNNNTYFGVFCSLGGLKNVAL